MDILWMIYEYKMSFTSWCTPNVSTETFFENKHGEYHFEIIQVSQEHAPMSLGHAKFSVLGEAQCLLSVIFQS